MKNHFAELLGDGRIRQFTWCNGLILIIFILVSVFKWTSFSPELPLFYSLPRSTDQLATPFIFLWLPFFSVIFTLVNFYLAALLYKKERLAALILTGMSTTASFLLFVTFIKIVFLIS